MGRPFRLVHSTLALAVAALVGCGKSSSGPNAATGRITLKITAVDGITPAVVVSGPDAYHQVVSASRTLSGLTAGSYTITADSVVTPDSIVGSITDTGNVTGSPAVVAAGSNVPVAVAYGRKDRVGGMWVANHNYAMIPELASSQLRAGGALVPAETLATKVSGPAGLALDAAGNMWESSYISDSLLMYSIAARNAGGGTPPTRVIVSPALQNANGIAFDANGNLWVANCGYHGFVPSLLEFSAAQLAAGGQVPTPAATIVTGPGVKCPYAIAFDGSGNIWVSDDNAPHITQFNAAQLGMSGTSTPTPSDTIHVAVGSVAHTNGIALDASGNLWTGGGITLVEYTPAMLAAGGAPAPTAILMVPPPAFVNGLAFDNRGTLWVADYNYMLVYGYTTGQLVTGSPTPAVTISFDVPGGVFPQQPLFDKYATDTAPSLARLRYNSVHQPPRALSAKGVNQ